MSKNNKELIKEVIEELRKMNLVTVDLLNPYQKTEKLISGYTLFKNSVEHKKQMIEDIKTNGMMTRHSSITERVIGGDTDYKSKIEKEQEKLDNLEKDIRYLENVIDVIDDLLKTKKDDKYYKIIELRYFENNTLEEIAIELNVDVSTVKRNRNRLINELSLFFFEIDEIKKLIKF